jgi:hypothetical protein
MEVKKAYDVLNLGHWGKAGVKVDTNRIAKKSDSGKPGGQPGGKPAGQSKKKESSSTFKKGVFCYTCGWEGHESFECRHSNHPEGNKDMSTPFAQSVMGKKWAAIPSKDGRPGVLKPFSLLDGTPLLSDGKKKTWEKKVSALKVTAYHVTGIGECDVIVNDVYAMLLIDTCSKGQDANFIDESLAKELGLRGEKSCVTCMMGNKVISLKEFININFVINKHCTKMKFYITRHLNEVSILIGREELQKNAMLRDILQGSCGGLDKAVVERRPPMEVIRMSNMLLRRPKFEFLDEEEENDEIDEIDIRELMGQGGKPTRIHGSIELQKRIIEVCEEFTDVFGTSLVKEPAKVEPFDVRVDEAKWALMKNRSPARPLGAQKALELKEALEGMLKIKIIRPSQAIRHSQVLMVKKKDGSHRLVVDYRMLNDATASEGYPIPNIKHMFHRIGNRKPKYFAIVDMVKGYHQVLLKKSATECTAFITPFGKFEWTRAPMGLKGLPSLFQCAMVNEVLSGLVFEACEVYMDDILIYGSTEVEFVDNLKKILKRLRDKNIKLSAGKCVLGVEQVEFVGHTISKEGVTFSPEKIAKVIDFPRPTTQKELKSFIGLANYFREHVKGHSSTTHHLEKLVKNYMPSALLVWGDREIQAFTELKTSIGECPQLFFLQGEGEIHLYTDACNTGIGAYLCQRIEGKEYPVAFMSRSYTPAQMKWFTPTQECYAIFKALEKFEYLLRDVKFILHTDHANLTYLNVEGSKLLRSWKLAIMEFDFDIEFVAGPENVVADYLSRMEIDDTSIERFDEEVREQHIRAPEEMLRLSNMEIPDKKREDRYRRRVVPDSEELGFHVMTIPKDEFDTCGEVHSEVAGHVGVEMMLERLGKRGTIWKKMRQHCTLYIRQCPACQMMSQVKYPIQTHRFTLATHGINDRLVLDTIGPLDEDKWGNKYVLVIMDSFSKWIELFPTKTTEGEEAADKLLQVIGRFGVPLQLQTDQGSQFKNALWGRLMSMIGTEYITSIAYSKEENGLVERANKEVMRHVRNIVFDRNISTAWSESLPLVQRIMNSAKRATGLSPAEIVFGNNINLDRGIFMPLVSITPELNGKVAKLAHWIDKMVYTQYLIVSKAIDEQMMLDGKELMRRNQQDVEKPKLINNMAENDFVLVAYPEGGPPSKLLARWKGPYRLVRITLNDVTVQNLLSLKCETVNITRIKKYISSSLMSEEEINRRDKTEWTVERIVRHVGLTARKSSMDFLVKFVGLPNSDNRWYAWRDLYGNTILHKYLEDNGLKKLIPKEFQNEESTSV